MATYADEALGDTQVRPLMPRTVCHQRYPMTEPTLTCFSALVLLRARSCVDFSGRSRQHFSRGRGLKRPSVLRDSAGCCWLTTQGSGTAIRACQGVDVTAHAGVAHGLRCIRTRAPSASAPACTAGPSPSPSSPGCTPRRCGSCGTRLGQPLCWTPAQIESRNRQQHLVLSCLCAPATRSILAIAAFRVVAGSAGWVCCMTSVACFRINCRRGAHVNCCWLTVVTLVFVSTS